MMKNSMLYPALGLAAVVVLSGCSDSSGTNSMPGMTGGMAHSSSQPAGQPAASGEHNAADTIFTQGMIPRHTQAVEMSGTILQKQGVDPRVGALATRIKAAQAPEIETMTT